MNRRSLIACYWYYPAWCSSRPQRRSVPGLCVVGLVSRLASQHRCGRRYWPRTAGRGADGGSGCGRRVGVRTAGPGAMDPGIHLGGAARQRDGCPNSHPFSAMDPGIHRGGQARRARWIRVSIAGSGPARRDGSGNPSRARRTTGPSWRGQARAERAAAAAARDPDQAAPRHCAPHAHRAHRQISTSRTDYAKTLRSVQPSRRRHCR